MATVGEPVILPPRTRLWSKPFSDENLDMLSHILDDFLRIPGTNIRFGLDGVIALIPGVGDLMQGLASTIIIVAAWARGVPNVTVARMVANVAIEVVVGAVPVLGDMFDIAWKANRRNYALLTGSLQRPEEQRKKSWVFFAGLATVLVVLLLLPLVLFSWLTAHFVHWMGR